MTVHGVSRTLARFAGVPQLAIDRAPEAVGMPATFGLLLLTATFLSATTMGYAAYRVAYGSAFAPLGGGLAALIWLPLIYSVDRMLLNGGTTGPTWAVTVKVAVRMLVAVLIGWSISTPVFLRFERNVIDLALHEGNRAEVAREAGENAQLTGLGDRRAAAENATKEARQAEQTLAAGPNASPAYTTAVSEMQRAERAARAVEARDLPAIGNARAQLQALPVGVPEASSVRARLHVLQLEVNEAHTDIARAEGDVMREEKAWRAMSEQRVTQTRNDATTQNAKFQAADQKTQSANAQSEDEIARLSTPNLATEWVTAEKIMADHNNPQSAPMRKAALLFHALFILIELLIVTLKLTMPPSAMDAVVASLEEEVRVKHTLMANAHIARMQMTESASTEVCAQWIDAWKAEQTARIHLGLTSLEFKLLRDEADNLMQNA